MSGIHWWKYITVGITVNSCTQKAINPFSWILCIFIIWLHTAWFIIGLYDCLLVRLYGCHTGISVVFDVRLHDQVAKMDIQKKNCLECFIISLWHVRWRWATFTCRIVMVAGKQKQSLALILIMACLKKKEKWEKTKMLCCCTNYIIRFLVWLLL